jgi:hypothetical protein
MTKRSLARRIWWVMVLYAAAVAIAVVIRVIDSSVTGVWYSTYKDLIPFLIALPAAWLGYCLQRRNSYMQQLRSLWSTLVETIQDANQYNDVCRKLSIAIDEIRGVFMNIGESDETSEKIGKGLYPFESMKDIHQLITVAGFGESTSPEALSVVRQKMFALWKEVRDALLKEFDREEPTHFDSHYVNNVAK